MFRAYEPERDRLAAVKLFRLDITPERVHRFAAELDKLVAANLNHPALASPIAAGIVGVSAYLAQDFVAADSLDRLLREHGALPVAEATRLASQLAEGLDAAAVVGLVHGGLHPRDVLVSADVARLTGVGIARALEPTGVAPPLRRPYTAPERAEGRAWDRRADVFSLAAVVHEMIWGRRLAGTGKRAAQTLTEVAGGDLVSLRRVFARALAEEPQQRFDTALEFVAALQAACSSVEAEPPVVSRVLRGKSSPLPAEHEPLLPLDEAILIRTPQPAALEVEPDLERTVDHPMALADDEAFDREPDAGEAEPELAARVVEDVGAVGEVGEINEITEADAVDVAYATEAADARSSTSIRPLALALFLGVAIGFAGGYALGYRAQPGDVAAAIDAFPAAATVSAQVNSSSEPHIAPREFTESPVKDVPLPSPKVTPAPREGRLQIRSTPAGARVFVDGQEVGRTPSTHSLANGGHDVRIVHDGYVAVERRVTVTPAAPASLSVALTPARAAAPPAKPAPVASAARGHGVLGVDSRPSGASVYVDGKLVGTTPLSLDNVQAGEHTVHLERDGYQRWNSSVRVVAGERRRVAASLER